MFDFRICILLLLFVFLSDINSKVLPDFIPICTRKEKDYGLCVRKAIEYLRPYFHKGIPRIRVPSYNPLEIPNVTVERYTDLLEMKLKLDNLKIYDMDKYQYNYIKADINKYEGEYSLVYPKLYITADYDIIGRFIALPLFGRGKFEANYTSCDTTGRVVLKPVKRKGIEYLVLDSVRTNIIIHDGTIKLTDNGPYTLIAETATKFANDNSRLTLEVCRPLVEETNDVIFRAISKRILAKIPLSELIPDE